MEKKLYEVVIKNENGEVVHSVKSDCIIAAINDPANESTAGCFITNCSLPIMASGFEAIKKIKEQAYKQHPLLMIAELTGLMECKSEIEKADCGGGADFLKNLRNS